LADITGAKIVIDSSKVAMHVCLGARFADVRAHVVHLVRDPRAIAYSWRRRSIDEVISGPTRVAMNWMASNLAIESLRRPDDDCGYTFVRYEDFIRNPKWTLEAIGRELGVRGHVLPFTDARTLHMEGNHTVAGSPSRFRSGDVQLVPDDEWREKMPARERVRATVPAALLLRRYAYPLRGD
jgi:hypothetical protein